ncbi:TIGR03667 family PPOX class F420-dependent oxidoreductase [Ktedonospora formicarum]|uniref:PPOX class F420-dependent oxidoreductase n=1 Tax=Ktedonospora formicarum TaxID=2778364 RepID=A0A8J3I3P3_9CHLR|nr:TIGR03667 family PPOX class F420-dependent oxidoreductase [Ktedonospora formicarum]GHO49592.1 PPOX class F420-dependent oxidoreductase [Ktedonospora formicarum]
MSVVLQSHVEERLRTNKMAWLTTVRPDGRPHTVPVWFLWEGATLLIWSKPHTRKIANLCQNPSVTLALDDTQNGFDVVVLEGTAKLLGKGEGSEAVRAYGEKYHEGLQRIGVPAEAFVMLYSQPIRITPTRAFTGQ